MDFQVCTWDDDHPSGPNYYCMCAPKNVCTAGERKCSGAALLVCEGGQWQTYPCSDASCQDSGSPSFDKCGWSDNKSDYYCLCNPVDPDVSVYPTAVHRAVECATQSLSGFTPNGSATCHPKNQWGETTFTLWVESDGHLDNVYCPSAGAGLGLYEFWCVDDSTGKTSNHVNFTILE